jgi:chromosome segregation ATPase
VDKQLAAQRFGGDQQRAEAAQRAIDIEKEIIRVQKDIQAARAAGRKEEVDAGITRIGQLDQVLAKERDIATGRKKLEEDLAKQREEAIKAVAQQQQQIQQQQQKAREEQRKAAEAEFNRQRSRIRDLNTLGAGVISGTDIRSSEGASLFQQLTANAQDPNLIEARLQTRRLGELVNLVAGLTNLPIRTIGALGVG